MRRWLLVALSTLGCLLALNVGIRVFDLFSEARARLDAPSAAERAADTERASFKQLHPYLGWRVRPTDEAESPRNLHG